MLPPQKDMFLDKLKKNDKAMSLMAIGTVGVLVLSAVLPSIMSPLSAYAYARPKANPVANTANSNEDWITYCKQYTGTARECATGQNNNGEYTSYIAHLVNGP